MKNPIEWARAIVKNVGWKRAWMICVVTGRPQIGNQNDQPNPYAYFYKMAKIWITKNVPSNIILNSQD